MKIGVRSRGTLDFDNRLDQKNRVLIVSPADLCNTDCLRIRQLNLNLGLFCTTKVSSRYARLLHSRLSIPDPAGRGMHRSALS